MTKTILFDVDGTLIDTERTIIQSWKKTLRDTLNIDPPEEELFYVLGIPGTKAVKKYSTSPQQSQELLELWQENDHKMFHYAQLFTGIEAMLQQLNDPKIQLGIVTSRTNQEMQVVLNNFDLEKYFTTFITASKTKLHKPNPEPILKAIETLKANPDDVIYIGDSIYDLQCAHNAQVKFALASWGAKDNPEFSKADYLLKHPTDLIDLV